MTGIVIRPAIVEDAAAIADVHVAAWRATYRGMMPDEILDRQVVAERTARWDAVLRQPRKSQAVIAESQKQVVGFALFGPAAETDPIHQGELHALYLLQPYQRQGIGRLLMQESASSLLRRHLNNMLVWVLSVNPARLFYEKMGGQYLRDRTIEISGASLRESAYGWLDISALVGPA